MRRGAQGFESTSMVVQVDGSEGCMRLVGLVDKLTMGYVY
jgi:hypothetical protein